LKNIFISFKSIPQHHALHVATLIIPVLVRHFNNTLIALVDKYTYCLAIEKYFADP
jgi:hypothetical protein